MREELLSLTREANDLQFFFKLKESDYTAKREEIKRLKQDLLDLDTKQDIHSQAKDFILSVNTVIQGKVRERIENLMTLALQDVFGYPYKVRLDFNIKRSQSEITITVVDGEMELSPDDELGGGIVDILSFSLRIILWFMSADKTDSVMLMDEPFKNLSAEYQPNASSLLHKLSDMFGIQFIIVTHETLLEHSADRVFMVKRTEKLSSVEKIRG